MKFLRTTDAVPVGSSLHMEARVLYASKAKDTPQSAADVVTTLDAPALANALHLVRLGVRGVSGVESLVVRGCSLALLLTEVHAVAAAPRFGPPFIEDEHLFWSYGPAQLRRDELACVARGGYKHFFRRERPLLLFLLHLKRVSHELYVIFCANFLRNNFGKEIVESGMLLRETSPCSTCASITTRLTPVEFDTVEWGDRLVLCEGCAEDAALDALNA